MLRLAGQQLDTAGRRRALEHPSRPPEGGLCQFLCPRCGEWSDATFDTCSHCGTAVAFGALIHPDAWKGTALFFTLFTAAAVSALLLGLGFDLPLLRIAVFLGAAAVAWSAGTAGGGCSVVLWGVVVLAGFTSLFPRLTWPSSLIALATALVFLMPALAALVDLVRTAPVGRRRGRGAGPA
jgi:hypothetical protein